MVPWICRAGPFQLHKRARSDGGKRSVIHPAAAFCACIRTLGQWFHSSKYSSAIGVRLLQYLCFGYIGRSVVHKKSKNIPNPEYDIPCHVSRTQNFGRAVYSQETSIMDNDLVLFGHMDWMEVLTWDKENMHCNLQEPWLITNHRDKEHRNHPEACQSHQEYASARL